MPSSAFVRLLLNDLSQSVYVRRDHAQGHRTKESIQPVGSDPIQSMVIQMVDGRFNRRVLLARSRKLGGRLARTIRLQPFPFLRKDIQLQDLIQLLAVLWRVIGLVHATRNDRVNCIAFSLA